MSPMSHSYRNYTVSTVSAPPCRVVGFRKYGLGFPAFTPPPPSRGVEGGLQFWGSLSGDKPRTVPRELGCTSKRKNIHSGFGVWGGAPVKISFIQGMENGNHTHGESSGQEIANAIEIEIIGYAGVFGHI